MRMSSYLAPVAILSCVSFSCLAQTEAEFLEMRKSSRAALESLANAPKPKEQAALDTMKLASAHRERAESVEERTNGLWQSWLVSICEGCGPQMLSYKQRGLGTTTVAANTGNEAAPRTREAAPRTREAAPVRRVNSGKLAGMYSDLSTENIDQIRRRPRQ